MGACADWFRTAHDQFTVAYRRDAPRDVTARFASSHTVSAQTFKLPPWTGSFNRPMSELEGALAEHWERHLRRWVDGLRYDWKKALLVPAIVIGVIALLLAMASIGTALVLLVVAGGITAYRINRRHQASVAAVGQAERVLADAKRQSLHALRDARSQLVVWQQEYSTLDAQDIEVHRMIDGFRGTTPSGSSFEGRTIARDGGK